MKNSLAQNTGAKDDLTGRDRLVSNVLLNWGAHSVFILAGFILPRMIDRRLGQELLGVWDFSWSLVSYFQLVTAAIGSSVNRYVARYRAAGDISGVNRTASSASFLLCVGGLLVIGLTVALSVLLPQFFGDRLGSNARQAQWVVLLLGATMGVQISSSALTGVLTGCHRWELHGINKSAWYAATVFGMILALLITPRLWILGAITLVGASLAAVTRVILAHRACEGLRLRLSLVRWRTITRLFAFGGKTLLPSVSNLLLNQATSILILAYLGPAALALYARPQSLMHHVRTLVNKMAMTLTPTASSLQSRGNVSEIRNLVMTSARYSSYLSLPIVLLLVIYGGPIMQLWMGPRYAGGLVPAILAIGYLFALIQQPVLNILAGMNAHGRAGVARFVASLCSVGLSVLVLRYLRWGLVGAAVAVTLPLTIVNVAEIARLICRQVGLDVKRYLLFAVALPAAYVSPFAGCLVAARLIFHSKPFVGLILGGTIGGLILAIVYWRYVLPERVCLKVKAILRSGKGREHAVPSQAIHH